MSAEVAEHQTGGEQASANADRAAGAKYTEGATALLRHEQITDQRYRPRQQYRLADCHANAGQQQVRDARRAARMLAKMDVSARETSVPSGIYRLSPATRDDLAKMDAWMVRITAISTPYAPSG